MCRYEFIWTVYSKPLLGIQDFSLTTMENRKSIPTKTKFRLFSEAAGHCQRPECLQSLFPIEMGGDKHIAEMAHVIPHGKTGPRYKERPAGASEVDSFENLILLCPTCHTIIDKEPSGYSRCTLLGWKSKHLVALAHKQGIYAYDERSQARDVVVAAMDENNAIWKEFAPSDGACFEYDPESVAAKTWEQRMRGVILPNHFRVQAIIKANLHHMTVAERQTFALYQEHIRGLSERHVCGVTGSAIRYPVKTDGIFA